MTFGSVQGIVRADSVRSEETGGVLSPEQATKNREIIRAVQAVNDSGGLAGGGELRYALEGETGRLLIRIVDPVTNEVIRQVPSETVLRVAEILDEFSPSQPIAI